MVFLVAGLFGVMPVVFSAALQDAEESPRLLFLSVMLALAGTWNVLFPGKALPSGRMLFRSGIPVPWFLFAGLWTVAALASPNTAGALFEWTRVALWTGLYLILAVSFSSTPAARRIFGRGVLVASILFIAAGLWQWIPRVTASPASGKPTIDYLVGSLLANKNFFSEVLLLAIPFLLILADHDNRFVRRLLFTMIPLMCAAVVALHSVAVWIAAVAGTATVLLLFSVFRNALPASVHAFFARTGRRNLALAATATALVVLLFAVILFRPAVSTMAGRLAAYARDPVARSQTGPENDNSVYERLVLWRNSVRMIADHPLRGSGPGTWKIGFPAYGMGLARYMQTGAVRFAYPHNDFLWIAAEAGLPALACFLAVLAVAAVLSVRAIRAGPTPSARREQVWVLSGLVMYAVIACFSMPFTRYYPVIFLVALLAMIQAAVPAPSAGRPVRRKWHAARSAGLLAALAGLTGMVIGYSRLRSDISLTKALYAQGRGDWRSMAHFLDGISKPFFSTDYTGSPVAWYQGKASYYAGHTAEARTRFLEAERLNPFHLQLLNDLGSTFDQTGDPEEAEDRYRRALAIAPYFPDARVNLAILYYNRGGIDSAYCILSALQPPQGKQYQALLNAVLTTAAREEVLRLDGDTVAGTHLALFADRKFLPSLFRKAGGDPALFRNLVKGKARKPV